MCIRYAYLSLILITNAGCLEHEKADEPIFFDASVYSDSGEPNYESSTNLIKCASMSNHCTTSTGSLFSKANGRADGILHALIETTDRQCDGVNDDHVVLQISILNQIQRLVISVHDIDILSKNAPLIGPAFSEGWHTGMDLDYVRDLNVHSADFKPATMAEVTHFICAFLEVGAPVSVFAYSDGQRPDSAHQVHRNNAYPDGAVVARPESSAPVYLLFRYTDQSF
ncbi:hypothetical protein KKF91_07615 [Myxococcota bacterium]|nr:hypothetical protein [Myxococcota bacterium]MBU1430410.1 hypothetical protein [Myxococcota bacterium]MBU1898736.1 hypothetical protein [Myxococcota bacterium]